MIASKIWGRAVSYKIDCLLLSETLLSMATLPAKRKSQAETEISSGKRVKKTEDSEVCGLQYGAKTAATSMVAHLVQKHDLNTFKML